MKNARGETIKCPHCGKSTGIQLWGDVQLEIKSYGLELKDGWGSDLKFDCSECDEEWPFTQEDHGL